MGTQLGAGKINEVVPPELFLKCNSCVNLSFTAL